MKISLLYNLNRGTTPRDTEFDLPVTIDALQGALSQGGHHVSLVEGDASFDTWIRTLVDQRPDVVFNIAEGFHGPARESVYAAVLDQLGIPYCGPGPTELLICHNKALTKSLVRSCVTTPPSALIRAEDELDNVVVPPFPLVIKLNAEGSSLGMSARSIVSTRAELLEQTTLLRASFGGDVLAESFIAGRDVSTSYIEGLGIFGPVQYAYDEGQMYDYTLKSVRNHEVDILDLPTVDALAEQAHEATKRIVDVLDLHGYARIDFRISPENDLQFLEVNGQVCFHPDGAFVRAPMAVGHSYNDVVQRILEAGASRPRQPSSPTVPYSSSMRR